MKKRTTPATGKVVPIRPALTTAARRMLKAEGRRKASAATAAAGGENGPPPPDTAEASALVIDTLRKLAGVLCRKAVDPAERAAWDSLLDDLSKLERRREDETPPPVNALVAPEEPESLLLRAVSIGCGWMGYLLGERRAVRKRLAAEALSKRGQLPALALEMLECVIAAPQPAAPGQANPAALDSVKVEMRKRLERSPRGAPGARGANEMAAAEAMPEPLQCLRTAGLWLEAQEESPRRVEELRDCLERWGAQLPAFARKTLEAFGEPDPPRERVNESAPSGLDVEAHRCGDSSSPGRVMHGLDLVASHKLVMEQVPGPGSGVLRFRREGQPPELMVRRADRAVQAWGALVEKLPHFDAEVESAAVLVLDTRYHLKSWALVGLGTINDCIAEPRDILRAVIGDMGRGFILMHNHPAGDPDPSAADRELTRRLREASETMGVAFFDHVIVGRGKYFSFKENCMM